jgi:hypothetical protein
MHPIFEDLDAGLEGLRKCPTADLASLEAVWNKLSAILWVQRI